MKRQPESIHTFMQGMHGRPIGIDVQYLNDGRAKPVVIFSHGFKGFKDWGHFNWMSALFANKGIVFVKFNFSHNGTTPENPLEFSDLEAFGNNNYMIELDDLRCVIDWLVDEQSLKQDTDPANITLLGHSRGGGISILKAAGDKRIAKLVTWASVSSFTGRNRKETIQLWERDGVVYTENRRTRQRMPLYRQFYDSLLENKERLNVIKAAKSLSIPFLIVHGTADEAVSIGDARQLHNACRHSELLVIEGAGHTFGVSHPFTGDLPEHAAMVIERTIHFIKNQ